MLRQSIGKGIRKKKKKKFCRNISFYTVYKILLANAPFRQMSIIEVLTCFEGPDFFFPLKLCLNASCFARHCSNNSWPKEQRAAALPRAPHTCWVMGKRQLNDNYPRITICNSSCSLKADCFIWAAQREAWSSFQHSFLPKFMVNCLLYSMFQ